MRSPSEIYVLQLGGAVCDVTDDTTAYTGRQAGFYWIVEPADDTRCLTWGRETRRRTVSPFDERQLRQRTVRYGRPAASAS